MANVSYIEPQSIRAGDTVTWRKSLVDYPAPTWSIVYTLINATHKITINGTSDGAEHVINIAATVSDDYVAGGYDYVAHVTDGTQRVSVAAGRMDVLPNLAVATTYDNRSHARKMLEAIESLLVGRASADDLDMIQVRHDIKMLQRDPGKLLALRDKYRAEVAAEDRSTRISQGLDSGRRIQVRLA